MALVLILWKLDEQTQQSRRNFASMLLYNFLFLSSVENSEVSGV